MGKRKQNKRESFTKRARQELEDQIEDEVKHPSGDEDSITTAAKAANFQIAQIDRIEDKVDLIIKDSRDNHQGSLTIWGEGLGIEKTIAVVEAIKRHYNKDGKRYQQDTMIKSDSSNQQPHLQVILKLMNDNGN